MRVRASLRTGGGRAALLLCLVLAGGCKQKPVNPAAGRRLQVAVVPKGSTHDFWKTIEAGAAHAARALSTELAVSKPHGVIGVDMIWKGPLREDEREQQIQVVEGFTAQGVDGIVLAPLDARALARPVVEAFRIGIATVVIDSALDAREIVSFVATDNRAGGALAADRLAALLGGKGKVILLRYQQGSASTEAREAGFLDRMGAAYPDIELLSSDQHTGPSRDTAKRAAENLLNRFGDDVQGIFAPNEPATMGVLLALEDVGKAGKVFLVGFDNTPAFVTALRKGRLHGIVVQDPFAMGDKGVRVMVDHLLGRKVPMRLETDAVLVTPDNLDEPRVQALLEPLASRPGGR